MTCAKKYRYRSPCRVMTFTKLYTGNTVTLYGDCLEQNYPYGTAALLNRVAENVGSCNGQRLEVWHAHILESDNPVEIRKISNVRILNSTDEGKV